MRRAAIALGVALLAASPCWAERATVEVENLETNGRLVITLGSVRPVSLKQHGGRVDLSVPAEDEIVAPDNVPRNVISMTGGKGVAHLEVVAGAHATFRKKGRVMTIDLRDPPNPGKDFAQATGSRPNPAKPAADPKPVAAEAARVVAVQARPAPPVAEPPHAEATPAPAAPPPSSAVAAAPPPASPAPAAPIARSFAVAAGPEAGVALFRRGGLGVVVFDDAVSLQDAGATPLRPGWRRVPRGVIATVPLGEAEGLTVKRTDDGFVVTVAPPGGSAAPITAVPAGMHIQVAKPGRTMTIGDPVTGQTLLIGTSRQPDGERAMVPVSRVAPGYALLPTWLGVAIGASSDRIDLRASLSGYTVVVADKATTNATAPARSENQFAIPVAAPAELFRQMNAHLASAAAVPPRARGPERVAAARSMLALGMSTEAAALLSLAATDDPSVARDPGAAALTGIAAVLAGRPADAAGLDDPALPTGGDVALWRGLRDLAIGKPAPALAGAWPLLSAYPDAIRDRIAPPVMEAAVQNGADVPAGDLAGPRLALARALRLEHDSQVDAAIAALGEIKNGRDERDSVHAAVALAELRLRLGRSGPAEAAEQLERQTLRWRGGLDELTWRLRIADLRGQAGQWRAALTGLRDTQATFPDRKVEIAAAQGEVFRSLLSADGTAVPPLDLVLIADEFADVMPNGADGDRLAGLLADKLAALDLPTRAVPVLRSLMDRSPTPKARSEYGLRLAQMLLDGGDAAESKAVAASLDLSGMPAEREEQRSMLLAQAAAAQGDFAEAASILLAVAGPQADEMRATFYARAGDWQRSLETLQGMAATVIPETGVLTDQQQDLLMREATAAVQAGDAGAVRQLARSAGRVTPPRADMFRLLTAGAVKGTEDLPRTARELMMARTAASSSSSSQIR